MKAFGRYALVIAGSLATGAALFVSGFVAMDFVWAHIVVSKPKEIGLGDGVMVVGGGFVILQILATPNAKVGTARIENIQGF